MPDHSTGNQGAGASSLPQGYDVTGASSLFQGTLVPGAHPPHQGYPSSGDPPSQGYPPLGAHAVQGYPPLGAHAAQGYQPLEAHSVQGYPVAGAQVGQEELGGRAHPGQGQGYPVMPQIPPGYQMPGQPQGQMVGVPGMPGLMQPTASFAGFGVPGQFGQPFLAAGMMPGFPAYDIGMMAAQGAAAHVQYAGQQVGATSGQGHPSAWDPPRQSYPIAHPGEGAGAGYAVGGAPPPQHGYLGGALAHPLHQGHPGPTAPPPQAPLSEGYRRNREAAYKLLRAMDDQHMQNVMFNRVDQDGDDSIDFKELQQALINMDWETVREDDCRKMIYMMCDDRDKKAKKERKKVSGTRDNTCRINRQEFKELIQYMRQFKALHANHDSDNDGFIVFEGEPYVTWIDFILICVEGKRCDYLSKQLGWRPSSS